MDTKTTLRVCPWSLVNSLHVVSTSPLDESFTQCSQQISAVGTSSRKEKVFHGVLQASTFLWTKKPGNLLAKPKLIHEKPLVRRCKSTLSMIMVSHLPVRAVALRQYWNHVDSMSCCYWRKQNGDDQWKTLFSLLLLSFFMKRYVIYEALLDLRET